MEFWGTTLPLFGWYVPDPCGELSVSHRIDRSVPHFLAWRVLPETIVILPIYRWSDRSRHESAAAVGADIEQHFIHTGGAKCAFVSADARLQRARRQRDVAVFTSGSQLKHKLNWRSQSSVD